MTIRVKVWLSIGFPQAAHADVLEIDDDATDDEIEEEVRDWKDSLTEWGWSRLDAEDGQGSAEG